MKHYLWSQVGVMNEVLTGKFCTCLGCGSALALNALLSSWISFISIKEKTQLTCAVRFNITKSSRDMAKPQPFHETNYTGQIKFMTSLTSLSAKFVWMSLDQPTCSTIHRLQMDRMLILSWDMGNIQQIKKNIIQDRKCLQTYTLLWNRSLGKLPNGNKKNLFSHKLTLFNQLYLIFTTISTAIIIRSSIIIIKHILVHKLRCVKVIIDF